MSNANPYDGYKAEKAPKSAKKTPEPVSQDKLRKYQDALTAIDKIEADLRRVKAEYDFDVLERAIKAAVPFNAFADGRLVAWFEEGRKAAAWKQAFVRLCENTSRDPDAECALVEAATGASQHLVVGPRKGLEMAADLADQVASIENGKQSA